MTQAAHWDEPVRGVWGHPGLGALPGIEAMRGFIDGRFALPPIGHLTGLAPTDAGLTHTTFALPVTRWLLDAGGRVQPGSAALVADAPLGSALSNSLPPGKASTTSELSISYLRPAGLDAERLIAHAEVIKAGRTTGLTQARIIDGRGRLLAHATSRLVVLDVPVDLDAVLPGPPPPPAEPDPWQRPAPGEPVDPAVFAERSGREVFEGWLRHELPYPPTHHLVGMTPTAIEDDVVHWRMAASPWLCSPGPVLYGGALAMLADTTLTTAVMPHLPPGMGFFPLDLRLRFVRPVLPGTGDMTAEARVVHQGRGLTVTQGTVYAPDGKPAILCESSLLLRPLA